MMYRQGLLQHVSKVGCAGWPLFPNSALQLVMTLAVTDFSHSSLMGFTGHECIFKMFVLTPGRGCVIDLKASALEFLEVVAKPLNIAVIKWQAVK